MPCPERDLLPIAAITCRRRSAGEHGIRRVRLSTVPAFELLGDGFASREAAILAVDSCSEIDWLKQALLGVVLLRQPFAIRYKDESEANAVAERIRALGFQCKVF